MTALKICGLKTPETLEAALAAGATHIGLNLFAKSPRRVSLEDAAALAGLARGRAAVVILAVDPDDELVRAIATLAPDFVQLHGQEDPARSAGISALAGAPIIKALGVARVEDLTEAKSFAEVAALLLLDARPPPGAAMPGGHGRPFDWSIIAEARPAPPFFLAGGLTPATVAEAILQVRPFGVDVSSGVERAPGVKDDDLIARFAHAVRQADQDHA
jgi:phosphoribosylanthranilate isomerase